MPTFTARHITGEYTEDRLLGQGKSFLVVQGIEAKGGLLEFVVLHDDGFKQAVNLITGALTLGVEIVEVLRPTSPLRLIYYKRMHADTPGGTNLDDTPNKAEGGVLEFVAVGWQATIETPEGPRNVRFGSRVWPSYKHFEVGEDL